MPKFQQLLWHLAVPGDPWSPPDGRRSPRPRSSSRLGVALVGEGDHDAKLFNDVRECATVRVLFHGPDLKACPATK
ncbi:hypothetical protein ACQP25_03045 [Microtetraspora malaysiensis]|uniref:hypothetical protein n=1 Tax=Microtetraspora malaysiensis TaxID=161358 RepID=UPI003D91C63B